MRNQKWTSDKWQLQSQANNNQNKEIYTYTYTPISKIKTTQQQKKSTIDWPSEQKKPKIMSTRTKLTKAQTGKQN